MSASAAYISAFKWPVSNFHAAMYLYVARESYSQGPDVVVTSNKEPSATTTSPRSQSCLRTDLPINTERFPIVQREHFIGQEEESTLVSALGMSAMMRVEAKITSGDLSMAPELSSLGVIAISN